MSRGEKELRAFWGWGWSGGLIHVAFCGVAEADLLDLMSETAKVLSTGAGKSTSAVIAKSDSDLCWKNVIKINLEARQQVCRFVKVFGYALLTRVPKL